MILLIVYGYQVIKKSHNTENIHSGYDSNSYLYGKYIPPAFSMQEF